MSLGSRLTEDKQVQESLLLRNELDVLLAFVHFIRKLNVSVFVFWESQKFLAQFLEAR